MLSQNPAFQQPSAQQSAQFVDYKRVSPSPQNEDNRKTQPHRKVVDESGNLVQQLSQRVHDLQQELDLVHNEYEAKLQEVTAKTAEKNEFFLNLIQQMQQRHYEEINYYRGLVDGFEEEKKQMGSIETKMNQIGAGIEDILRESSELSRTNEELERKLLEKDKIIEGLRKQASKSSEALEVETRKIDEYEKLRLKQVKRNKDLMQMIEQAEQDIREIVTSSRFIGNQICPVTKLRKRDCHQHCTLLSNLSSKYDNVEEHQ